MYFLCLNTLQHACYFNLNLSVCFNIDGFEVYCLCFVFWLKLYVIILRWLIRDLVSVMAPWSRNNLSMYLASHLGPLSDRLANILVSFWSKGRIWANYLAWCEIWCLSLVLLSDGQVHKLYMTGWKLANCPWLPPCLECVQPEIS